MTSNRTIRRSTVLDAPADLVWAAVRTPQAFRFVARGLVDWRPVRHRTEPWQQGDEATGWLLLGGVVPFSMHRIRVETIDDHERVLRSDESGGVIRSWRHDILVEPLDDGLSRYTDVVHIDAGPLTPVVAAFAWFLYRKRQRRWRVLATILAGTDRSRHAVAWSWLRRHESAFNNADVDSLSGDYTDDVVLEAHMGGQRMELSGPDVRAALTQATAAGQHTRVSRVAASGNVIAAKSTTNTERPTWCHSGNSTTHASLETSRSCSTTPRTRHEPLRLPPLTPATRRRSDRSKGQALDIAARYSVLVHRMTRT